MDGIEAYIGHWHQHEGDKRYSVPGRVYWVTGKSLGTSRFGEEYEVRTASYNVGALVLEMTLDEIRHEVEGGYWTKVA